MAAASQPTNTRTIAVIDGNSLMHRAFHAVPPTMNAPDGAPTNAVFGFISMFIKMVETLKPDAVICAFDAGRPAFRMEALERYKAQRPPMDDNLKVQFPLIERLLKAMGIPVVKVPGWEGDDILGTLSLKGEQEGDQVLLVTGDKDIFQLASSQVKIVSTRKGITDVAVYGPAEVQERYGVTPDLVPDFLGLKGDPSDNIPGVPGVGEKTAAKLIQQYGGLDSIYAHADEIKGKLGEKVRDNEDAARTSKLVATIRRDVPIDLDPDLVTWPSFDPNEVRQAFGELRFTAHLNKVLALGEQDGNDTCETSADGRLALGSAADGATVVIEPVVEGDEAQQLLDDACDQGLWLGVGLEEGDGAELFGETRTLYVASDSAVARFEGEQVPTVLARLARGGRIVGHDLKSLLQVAVPKDSAEPAAFDPSELSPERLFDTSIAAYLLMSNAKAYPVSGLLLDNLGVSVPTGDDALSPALIDAAGALALRQPLLDRMGEENALTCFNRIELPLIGVLLQMERTGTALDQGQLKCMAASTSVEIEELKGQIYELAGEEFNIDSPKQLGAVLFEKLELPVRKKTKTGYSTDAKVLTSLAGIHPLPEKVLHYRELAKMKSTYLDALPEMANAYGDKRLHTTFNQTITTTGRLSSSDPNLQNIPVRTDFGRRVREAFTPCEDDYVFVSADYSQIELRLLAHLSADEHLMGAFNSGADFHRSTAARVFGVDFDDVTPEMRSRAKAVNFGIVYGQQAFGLSQSLHISMGEAQEMIDRYFESYPDVRSYLDRTVKEAKEKGYAETIFGRRRHIPELASRNANLRSFGERTAMNHPMQGSAADIIKLAMAEVARRMHEAKLSARLVLQVHDELDFECPLSELDALSDLVGDAMSNIVKLNVPLIVDVSSGKTWAEAH